MSNAKRQKTETGLVIQEIDLGSSSSSDDDDFDETSFYTRTNRNMRTNPIPPPSAVKEIPNLSSEVVLLVLNCLDNIKDLINCRLVNSLWSSHASQILRGHDDSSIKFTTLSHRQKTLFYISPTGFLQVEMTLNTLTSCLKTATKMGRFQQFPCTRFGFRSIDLDSGYFQKFIATYGELIQRLELTYGCHSTHDKDEDVTTTLAIALTEQCPNIEHLIIDEYIVTLNRRKEKRISQVSFPRVLPGGNKVNLPRLKRLDCPQKELVEGILDVSPNLEYYIGLGPHFVNLRKFVITNKISTIQHLSMELSPNNIQFYENFVTSFHPNLKVLGIEFESLPNSNNDPNFLSRVGRLITDLLESSKDTLESITRLNPLGNLPENSMNIPRCEKLTQLSLMNNPVNGRTPVVAPMFPPHLDLLDTFPNVTSVAMNLQSENPRVKSTQWWLTFFPFDLSANCFFTVKRLTLHCHFRPSCTQELNWMFPSLEHLSIGEFRDVSAALILENIWTSMKDLTSLNLFDISVGAPINSYPSLDSAITGFSSSTCTTIDDLRKDGNDGNVEELTGVSVQDLRAKPSMLELKKLTQLTIQLVGWGQQQNANVDRPILSRLSGMYGFQLMPQLKVFLIARINSTDPSSKSAPESELESVVPFVHSLSCVKH